MEQQVRFNNTLNKDLDLRVTEDGKDYYCLTVGKKSYVSEMSIDSGAVRGHITIGRYTSIAKRIVLEIGFNHNHHLVSTFPFKDFDSTIDPTQQDLNHYYENNHYHIIVGNDVWIGDGVRILGGVHIGDGAVIGMGAVVTRDVPPYAVVVGNPASVTKYRFDEDTIARLMQIRWWNWDEKTIQERVPEMGNPKAFAERYYKGQVEIPNSEFTDLMNRMKEDGVKTFYFVLDCNAPLPLWKKVLSSFMEAFKRDNRQILIVNIPSFVQCDSTYQDAEKDLNDFAKVCEGIIKVSNDDVSFYHSDVYVAGNDIRSLAYLDKASAIGMEVRSACDWQSGLF